MRTEIVLALDIKNRKEIIDLAERVKNYVHAFKVGYPAVLSLGTDIIEDLSGIRPVIADFKIADIPYISSMIAEIAFEKNASAVIVHGFIGRDGIRSVLKVARKYDGEVYVVTELTSSEEFFIRVSNDLARIARDLGCHGIIAPGNRPERIRELKEIVGDMKILCPGIGVQGGRIEDSVRAGATHIIVGRIVYLSKDPEEQIRRIHSFLKFIK